MCLGERASQESHHLFEGFVKLRLSIDKPLFFARLQFDREKDSSAEHPTLAVARFKHININTGAFNFELHSELYSETSQAMAQ